VDKEETLEDKRKEKKTHVGKNSNSEVQNNNIGLIKTGDMSHVSERRE